MHWSLRFFTFSQFDFIKTGKCKCSERLSLETLKNEYVYLMRIFKIAAINTRSLENARLYISNESFTSPKEYIDAIKFILMKMVTDPKIYIRHYRKPANVKSIAAIRRRKASAPILI